MIPPPYLNSDKHSFGYDTARVRWPKIINGCITDLPKLNTRNNPQLLQQFHQLLNDINDDRTLQPFTPDEIKLNSHLKLYNEHLLANGPYTWKTGPWLYLECHLYQVINNIFLRDNINIDIFQILKQSTLVSSQVGIIELCKNISNRDFRNVSSKDKLVYFKEFIDISLWGNSTDLSLLAGNVSLDDIKSIQGEETRKLNEKNILVNDTFKIFEYLNIHPGGIIDIVLDNSGFELFSDLVLAIYLVEAGLASKVNFHCKLIPWFVSDTLPKDFDELFIELDKFQNDAVSGFVHKCKQYITTGKFNVKSDAFWTLPLPYWDLAKYPIYSQFQSLTLLIFKGDLNYRKLTGDVAWPKTTSFAEAIQGLLTAGLPIVTLRTCKADVTVGLPPGVEDTLINSDGEFWSSSGKFAVINFFKP